MDFNRVTVSTLASFLIVIRRFILLIFRPYQAMRKISTERDYAQVFIILLFVFGYFLVSSFIRKPTISFVFIYLIFLANFLITILFFFGFEKLARKDTQFASFVLTFSYMLFPTLIWFIADSLSYYLLPPPRTSSMLGRTFSIFFTAFSLSLLIWKVILVYLAIRFSAKQQFYRIFYYIVLYLCLLTPYSFFLYKMRLFRIPFI